MSQVDLGRFGENIALEQYLNDGYQLVARNFQYYGDGRAGRLGEIDLIMAKNGRLYLIEVKTRSDQTFGRVAEQVTKTKMRYIYNTYLYFIQKYPQFKNHFWQFDLVTVLRGKIHVIRNAFSW
jgi:putative endonuclease